MATSALVTLKTLFIIMMSIMAITLVYVFIMDRFASCFDLNAWWTQAEVTDVLICLFFIVVWLFYKESSWITRIIVIVLIYCCGSCHLKKLQKIRYILCSRGMKKGDN